MPLVKIERVNANCKWGLWKIEEPTDTLFQLLGPEGEDLMHLQKVQHPVKQAESLAARLVLRHLLEEQSIPYQGLQKDNCARPFLVAADLHISLSHAQEYAVALTHQQTPVGIDMELPREQLRRISPKYLSASELKHANQNLNALAIYWVAKEAIYKMYGKKRISLRRDIFVHPFMLSEEGSLQASLFPNTSEEKSYRLTYFRYGPYYVAFTNS